VDAQVRAVQAWLETARIVEGPVFRPLDRFQLVQPTQLSAERIALIVKRRAKAVGLDPARYAGHSLRAGLATSAAAAGASERVIMSQTGHRSADMVRKYVREGNLFTSNAAALVGLQLKAALRRAGRQRGIAAACVRLQAIFRRTWLHQLPLVEDAMGRQSLALLKQLEAAAQAEDELAEATRTLFKLHPDAAMLTSFPGLGEIPAARLLAEIGDDRTRFADARGLKAYAGAAPVTRASGKKLVILHRTVKNQRLAAVGYLWTFAALRLSAGARAHYDRRRIAGDRHTAAQRNLFNRFLGCLYYCLQTHQAFAEERAFPSAEALAA